MKATSKKARGRRPHLPAVKRKRKNRPEFTGLRILGRHRFLGLPKDELLLLEPLASYDAAHPPVGASPCFSATASARASRSLPERPLS